MKRTAGEKIFNVINIIIMVMLCIITLYPYLNQLAIAFNDSLDTATGGLTFYPRQFTLDNFVTVLQNQSIANSALISVLRVIIATLLSLTFTIAAAYALTRRNLKGRKFFTWYLCIPMYFQAGVIPTYILLKNLHMMNNFLVYVIPASFSFYNMVVIRSFLQELPASLEESAMLDGANEIVVLFRIILPLAKPVIATIALWVAVDNWNDWTTTLYYVTDNKLYTLQYVMMQVIKQSEMLRSMAMDTKISDISGSVSTESVQSAVLIVGTIPIIAVYPFLQKYFIKGVTLGAVKG